MQTNVMGQMPAEIMRPGTDAVMGALMAPSSSDTQTVLEMNEYLENNHLTATGQAWAEEALGKDVVAAMRKRYGASADVFIAQASVAKGGVGGARGKVAAMKRMEAGGANPLGTDLMFTGGDLVAGALAGGMKGDIFKSRIYDLEGGVQGAGITSAADGLKAQEEIELNRTANVITSFSGATASFAQSVLSFKNTTDELKRMGANALTGGMAGGQRTERFDVSNTNSNLILGHDGASQAPVGGIPLGF
jgi:hypothetical protein